MYTNVSNDVRTKEYTSPVKPTDNNALSDLDKSAFLVKNPEGTNCENSDKIESKVRTKNDIYKAIQDAIKNYKITEDEALNIIYESGNYNEASLLQLDNATFNKIILCLINALKDSTVDGNTNIKNASKKFVCYKFLTVTKNNPLSIEESREKMKEMEKLSLIDMIKLNNPELAKKGKLSTEDIKNAIKKYILQNTNENKIKELKQKPDAIKEVMADYFNYGLKNCTPEEKELLFKAFAMLLRDEDMKEHLPVIVDQMVKDLEDVKKIEKFINYVGPEILKELGFREEEINIILNKSFENMGPEELKKCITSIAYIIKSIDEKDIPTIKKVFIAKHHNQLENITKEEWDTYNKYAQAIQNGTMISASMVKDPKKFSNFSEEFKYFKESIEEKDLETEFYINLEDWFENHQELFEGISKDDFIKTLNQYTNNAFGDAIGDTNEANRYTPEDKTERTESTGFGFATTPRETIENASIAAQNISLQIFTNTDDKQVYFVESDKKAKQEENVEGKMVYQNLTGFSGTDIHLGLKKGYLKVSDALNKYNDLSESGKNYMNKLVEVMSESMQQYVLKPLKNFVKLAIIRKTHIKNAEKMDLALDYSSRKQLEKMTEEKKSA